MKKQDVLSQKYVLAKSNLCTTIIYETDDGFDGKFMLAALS